MRIYKDYSIAISEARRDVAEMGILCHSVTMQDKEVGTNKDYATLELLGYSYMIQPIEFSQITKGIADLNEFPIEYVLSEFADRIAKISQNPGSSWTHRPDVWKEFLEDGGHFSYTYSERMHYQVPQVIELIKQHRDTRQAVIPIYNGIFDNVRRGGARRVPCSMHYQFIPRGDQLHMIYSMRSCDVITHFPVDVAVALTLLDHIANKAEMDRGNFIHQIGSLHMYRKDAKGIF